MFFTPVPVFPYLKKGDYWIKWGGYIEFDDSVPEKLRERARKDYVDVILKEKHDRAAKGIFDEMQAYPEIDKSLWPNE